VIRACQLWSSPVSKFKSVKLFRGSLLPGENPAEFEELHQALNAEVALTGALGEDIVATWRAWSSASKILQRLALRSVRGRIAWGSELRNCIRNFRSLDR
jgi:hypothetical protein